MSVGRPLVQLVPTQSHVPRSSIKGDCTKPHIAL